MSDLLHSSYAAIVTVLDTGLNSLANNGKVLSGALDNSTDLALYDDLELYVAGFGSAPTTGFPVDVYVIPSIDGTNYGAGDASTEPPQTFFVGAFTMLNSTGAQYHALRDVPIPPGKFKYLLRNSSGQTMAATLNTLKRRAHGLKVT